jgi:hypothetical protein
VRLYSTVPAWKYYTIRRPFVWPRDRQVAENWKEFFHDAIMTFKKNLFSVVQDPIKKNEGILILHDHDSRKSRSVYLDCVLIY